MWFIIKTFELTSNSDIMIMLIIILSGGLNIGNITLFVEYRGP